MKYFDIHIDLTLSRERFEAWFSVGLRPPKMFNFLSTSGRKPVSQRVFSIVYFADATPISSGWVDFTPMGDLPCVDAESKFHRNFELGDEPVILDGTGLGCSVMFMLKQRGTAVTSNVLVGSNTPEDQSLLQLFVASSRQTKLVQQLATDANRAFEEILTTTERPLCVTLLAPVGPDQTDRLLEWQGQWVGARMERSKKSCA